MKRHFVVWNMGYKQCHIIADDQAEALTMCQAAGFLRRASAFRKLADRTDHASPGIMPFLEGDRSGLIAKGDEGNWSWVK